MKTLLLSLLILITLPLLGQDQMDSPIQDSIHTSADEIPIFAYDEMDCTGAEFQCGIMAFASMVFAEMDYFAILDGRRVSGSPVMEFVIERDGSMSNIRCMEGCGNNVGEEMVRIIGVVNERELRWSPAKRNGETVRYRYEMPLKFDFKLSRKAIKAMKKIQADRQLEH